MTEELLQYIWNQKHFPPTGLVTTSGEPVEVIDTGLHNRDAGPDFFNARVKIGETTWAGNVEIHQKSSDWRNHKHQNDSAYDSVILHVVAKADGTVVRKNGEEIPCMVLPVDEKLEKNYHYLRDSNDWIPCAKKFPVVDPFIIRIGMHAIMVGRLQGKLQQVDEALSQTKGNWNEAFYRLLARNFGFNVNAMPFEMLAKSLRLTILGKHRKNLVQLEALLFGQAGMLKEEVPDDPYHHSLKKEYAFLAAKYGLKAMESHLWKFMRLRPVNFPTIRIAQFAALVNQSHSLFSYILDCGSLTIIKKLFTAKASEYWDNHYTFNKLSKGDQKRLGESAINTIVINTVVPFLFAYGEIQNKQELKDRALGYLEEILAETNAIIKGWKNFGVEARSAFDSQALLQLKKAYCEHKRCLECQIGKEIIVNEQL